MFLLAHLAAGYVVGRAWNMAFRRHQVNVWLATLGGILPDIIDKPLSLLPAIQGGRTVAHSLLFLALLGAAIRIHRGFLPLMLGVATHLILDDPGTYMATLAWPFLGPEFAPDENMSPEALHRHIRRPRTSQGEIVGAVVLGLVAVEHAWSTFRRRRALRMFNVVQVGRPLGFDLLEARVTAVAANNE